MKFLLAEDTQAMQIHGKTHAEIGLWKLERGAAYDLVARYTDERGTKWQRILVDGYLYDIEEKEPVYDKPPDEKPEDEKQ